jgi:PAS domain S-box-containing protein
MTQTPLAPERLDADSVLPLIQGLAALHEAVLMIDPSGRIVWVSERLGAMLGGAEKLCGERWTRILADPDEAHLLSERLAASGRVSHVELRLAGDAGKEITASVSAARIGPDPLTSPVVAILRLGGRAVAREFAAATAALRVALDTCPDAVLIVDRSRFITYANAAIEQVAGYCPDELVDQPLALFVGSGDDFEGIVRALGEGTPVRSQNLRVRQRDGASLCVSVSASLLTLESGGVGGAIAYLRDVTESRQEAALSRKNDELEHYVHAVSHDLRSPLVSLLGFTRLLREDYSDRLDEKGRHFLDRVEQAGRTMEGLIHDLLELSRIGRAGEFTVPVNPRAVLLALAAELKPRLDTAGIELILPEDTPTLDFDRTRLYQLFSNLIGNALEHMGQVAGARIQVEVREHTDHALLVVSDNGRGIAPDDQERIFEIFQSLPAPGGSRRGTGIGLAVVRKIAETRGGRAWVESRPGHGATFKVRLPNARAGSR